MKIFAIAATLLLLSSSARAEDWPFYGHDHANTFSAPSAITRANVAGLRLLWAYDTGEDMTSTPVVVGGVVYAAGWSGGVYALDRASGALLWRYQNGAIVSSTPAVAGGRVFVSDYAGKLFALSAVSGALLWETDLSEGKAQVELSGSPVAVEGSILLGISSGQEDFNDPLGGILGTSGTIDFVGGLAKVDQVTGAVEWLEHTVECAGCTGAPIWTTPAIDLASRTAFAGTGNAYTQPADGFSDAIVAFDLDTGEKRWARQFTPSDVTTLLTLEGPDYDFGASPNLFPLDGRLVVGEGQKGGHYHVVDAQTGSSVWTRKLALGSHFGGFLGSTATAGGKIFAGVLNSGIILNPLDSPPIQDPFGIDTLATVGKTFAFTQASGAVAWWFPSVPALASAPAVAGGVMYQGDLSGIVWARDAASGLPLWFYETGGIVTGGIAVSDGQVFAECGVNPMGWFNLPIPQISVGRQAVLAFGL